MLNFSNMFMWYVHVNYHDYHDAVKASFRFINVLDAEAEDEVEVEESKVTACGIRLLYLQDAEELGIHQ
ncbi:hypothetical protein TIFTF001_050869 [Ficus carica]|uniref:Uncharacterized protein n=1 Tax=Ficus carica TaxID=3494 RepID=A0AA87YYY0_FICCA|nr:hypothetical protein TIFTF001_050866 [Ficus carica]GMN18864.1 hypothetical protein TIFTF001_050867 [Ficus carica]GMN18871.1 hypothetical protein TIFTF001_050868 [Ficus carica]GMN18880.1 hypothetical protein TIFTF001_050869 [Ficus carica]